MTTLASSFAPLATRLRPRLLDEYIGQSHLVTPGKPLHQMISQGRLHSMILWGPPGTGKTTLASVLSNSVDAEFENISAVLAGVKEVRAVVERATLRQQKLQRATVLFVDEVHRFNKAQQDAFLPHIESGTLVLIGATTENPSFQLNNALLSRARVYVLKQLTYDELATILQRALSDKDRGYGLRSIQLTDIQKKQLIQCADGDARVLLNLLESLVDFAEPCDSGESIPNDVCQNILSEGVRRFDQQGDIFYDQISALHKSVRGSDPDAALYWLARMFDGGCDPYYIARRVLRIASEDVGLADPRAMHMALQAWQSYERLGSPEGELAIAQAVIYLASTAKSNASYLAFNQAMTDAKQKGSLPVPKHLCNAPTRLMKQLDYGKDYRYAHNETSGYAAGECYFPEEMEPQQYYQPVQHGLEIKLAEKLARLRAQDLASKKRRRNAKDKTPP